ncbi:bacteriocin-like protein [Chryseobacterium sp. SG20098]
MKKLKKLSRNELKDLKGGTSYGDMCVRATMIFVLSTDLNVDFTLEEIIP